MPISVQFLAGRSAMPLRAALSIVVFCAWQLGQTQTFTALYQFTGASDGANPAGGLTLEYPDPTPNVILYGTAVKGGASGYGNVFEITLPNNSSSTPVLQTVYSFTGTTDGANPVTGVTNGPSGSLYGTTAASSGGLCATSGYCGTVFLLTPGSNSWTKQTLYSFNCSSCSSTDGYDPYGGLTLDASGNLYGTTRYGGATSGPACNVGTDPGCICGGSSCGTAYMLTKSNSYPWQENLLRSFGGSNDGREPAAAMTFDAGGHLYGTTVLGGYPTCIQNNNGGNTSYDLWGCGIIFKLTKSGTTWTEAVVQTFMDNQQSVQDGSYPLGSLFFDSSSQTLYGANANSYPTQPSNYNGGEFFEISSAGSFTPIGSGIPGPVEQVSGPHSGLVMDSMGNLYGTTQSGGTNGYGSVFELPASGSSWGTFTTLYSFMGGSDGKFPSGNLAIDSNGNLYGTTYSGGTGCSGSTFPLGCGVIFELTP